MRCTWQRRLGRFMACLGGCGLLAAGLLGLALVWPAQAEVCEGSFVLSTQDQVNAFAALGCAEVIESLAIEESSDITSLTGLVGLPSVEEDLRAD